MQSASSLIDTVSSRVIQNPNVIDTLYNPNIPVKGATTKYDKFTKPSHNVNLKTRYYQQMILGNTMKNGDTYTLGSNSKGLNIFQDYDRAIDSNMMRRRDPTNNKQTIANDYATGSYDAYYRIPITTKQITKIDVGADPMITKLNKQIGYNARFQQPTATAKPKPTPTPTDNAGYAEPQPVNNETPLNPFDFGSWFTNLFNGVARAPTNVSSLAGIGTDPTEDPEYIRMQEELRRDREEAELQRDILRNKRSGDTRDKYGNPLIRSGTKRNSLGNGTPLNPNNPL